MFKEIWRKFLPSQPTQASGRGQPVNTGDDPARQEALYRLVVTISWEDQQNLSHEWHYEAKLKDIDASHASRQAWKAFCKERDRDKDWSDFPNPKISCKLVE